MQDYRLIYLWVNKYKNIEDEKLQLSLDYTVEVIANTIKVTESNFYSFGGSTELGNPLRELDAYSAVIGENGSGKSHLLELLTILKCTGRFPQESDKCFCVIEITNNNEKYIHVISNHQYEFDTGTKAKRESLFEIAKNAVDETAYGVIQYQPLRGNYKPYLLTEIDSLILTIDNDPIDNNSSDSTADLAKCFFQNALAYLQNRESSHACFLIQYAELRKAVMERINESVNNLSKRSPHRRMLSLYIKIIDTDSPNLIAFELAADFLIVRYQITTFLPDDYKPKLPLNILTVASMFLNYNIDSAIQDELINIQQYAEKIISKHNYQSVHIHAAGYIRRYFRNGLVEHSSSIGANYSILISDKNNIDGLRFLIDGLSLEGPKHNGLTLKIDGLSSGEVKRIHFLSGLKSKLADCNTKYPLIVLDEADTTFHPEWQRTLIADIHSIIFECESEPQLVIASHSPLILSDILSDKVLVLQKGQAQLKTFAANIHELLADSFFLRNTIGELAKTKISLVTSFIANPKFSSRDLPDNFDQRFNICEAIVEQVADSFLQSELKARLFNVFEAHKKSDDALAIFMEHRDNPDFIKALIDLKKAL